MSLNRISHDDDNHIGSAKRDSANGLAGLDVNGNLIVPGETLYLTRDGANNLKFKEKTSNEEMMVFSRSGSNDFYVRLNVGGSLSVLQTTADKDIVNGIAGLDASSKQIPAQHFVSAPAAANSTGTAGQMAYDASYFYLCYATDTWMRIAHAW